MHVFSLNGMLLNGIEIEEMKNKQIFVTFEHIPFLVLVVQKSLLSRNEEKLVAIVVYSSFLPVATSGFRIIPLSLVVAVELSRPCSDED